MKTTTLLLAALCLLVPAALHAEEPVPVPAPLASHAESAVSKPHAESAEAAEPGSPAGGAAERSEAEGVPHAAPAASRAAEPRAANTPLGAEVSLTDGSLLKGALRRRFLPAESAILGRLRIDLSSVSSIAFEPDPAAAARVAFRNGDLVSAVLAPKHDHLVLDTLVGPLAIPLRAVASLAIASDATDALIYHCTFDSPSSITRPAAGPAGRFLGGDFVPGKVGSALRVKAGEPAAEVSFGTGLMQPKGCIEFWAKIENPPPAFPDGGNPQFFAMGVGPWLNTFVKYTANDGFGTGGLHADLPGSAYVSSLPSWGGSARYPEFLGDPAAWHHYALVWSEEGLPAASEALGRRVVSALYVDGRLVNPSYGHNGPDRAKFLRQFSDLPVVLGFPIVPGRQRPSDNRVGFLIDEFKVWNFPKTDFSVSTTNHRTTQPPKLLYHCTFDSAEAVEKSAAGPVGKFLGGEFVPGKTGNALRIEVDKPGFDAQFSKGTLGPEGTIEFWAKIEGDDPHFFDGGDPLFFSMYNEIGSVTLLQFAQNNGFGRGGLGGAMAGWPFGTADHTGSTADYSEFLGANWADWHHYAMSWKADGFADGSFVKVFVDGKSKSLFGGVNDDKVSGALSDYGNHNYSLGSPWSPTWGPRGRCNKKSFLIDEFKIWSAPTTVFDGISIR